MSALAIGTHQYGNELLVLAAGSVCEAREVSSEIRAETPSFADKIITLWHCFQVRKGLQRLTNRQAHLLSRFAATNLDSWEHHDCQRMASLLDELIDDERSVLEKIKAVPAPLALFWKDHTDVLTVQVDKLAVLCIHIDALSVRPTEMPGDAEMQDFLDRLAAPEECNLTLD